MSPPPGEPIKLFICDVDGCLAPANHGSYDLSALLELRRLNRLSRSDDHVPPLTLLTGRPVPYVDALLQILDLHTPAAFEHGAGLTARSPQRSWLTTCGRDGQASIRRAVEALNRIPGAQFQGGKESSLSISSDELTLDEVAEAARDVVRVNDLDLVVHRATDVVDVLPSRLDKEVGLASLCRTAKVDPREAAGVGDSNGDIGWLRACGRSFAPLHAAAEVRRVVDVAMDLPDVEATIAAYETVIQQNRAR
jgi:hypothetical protein